MSIQSSEASLPKLDRRALLQRGVAGLFAASAFKFGSSSGTAQPVATSAGPAKKASLASRSGPAPLNRFPRSVQEYYVRRALEVERAADVRRAALRTKAEAEAYLHDVRARIKRCFGPLPEKTPLNARVTAVHPRDGYRIENVIFESRPGFPVTANLYVPTGRTGPLPGVIGTCGHSDAGKAYQEYQSFAQALARQGYVTLIHDPMGQGERVQHVDAQLKPRVGLGPTEHLYVGNRMALVGENLPAWFVWDGVRALDYLLTRPEVDPRHIGVTGNSGGGTQTAWLCAMEPRFTMAAPSCFVTAIRRNLENENAADAEQYPWCALTLGLDHSDFVAAMAPKPVILLGQEKDYFDARGLEQTFGRLKHLYRLLGAEENVALFIGSDYHGYARPNREAMYGWFNRQTRVGNEHKEPALTLEKEETLRCTPQGQVAGLKPETVFSITSGQSKALRTSRRGLTGAALERAIATALKLPPRTGVADYRILRPSSGRAYPKSWAATYAIETEPGIHAVVYRLSDTRLVSRVPRGPKRALLYVSHRSADAELRDDTWLKELLAAESQSAIFACDVRGVGESRPLLSLREGICDYFHAGHGLMFDCPTPGQRTFDLLRVIDWLREHGHTEVHLVARGWGAIPATFAAVAHETVIQVTLRHALTSYSDLAEAEEYEWPLSAFVPGILQSFDLPDCYRELARKNLRQIDAASVAGVPV